MNTKLYDTIYNNVRQGTLDALTQDDKKTLIRLQKLYEAITMFEDEDFISKNIGIYHDELSQFTEHILKRFIGENVFHDEWFYTIHDEFLFDEIMPLSRKLAQDQGV